MNGSRFGRNERRPFGEGALLSGSNFHGCQLNGHVAPDDGLTAVGEEKRQSHDSRIERLVVDVDDVILVGQRDRDGSIVEIENDVSSVLVGSGSANELKPVAMIGA